MINSLFGQWGLGYRVWAMQKALFLADRAVFCAIPPHTPYPIAHTPASKSAFTILKSDCIFIGRISYEKAEKIPIRLG
jgi:hypothetical protein